MKRAFKIATKAGIRTLAQALAGGMGALGVASIKGFESVPEVAAVLVYGALIGAAAAFFQNLAENIPSE